ncbi:hypothetical protein OUZ56_025427 [Daphnia magna]|uniref:Uncharacterized protein n=1 Tax=Daphnia magna TaxID=35525 RepID=A0ABQ9ZKF9_9CRUS|nr:hypothetical protein OUZ56_025427 [Daphnia magna]
MISQRATVVFVVMAQPLVDSFPPMRICSFGSDNKLSFNDVRHRLQTIRAELEKFGIEILTYSADGDSRELKMMREHMKLGLVPKICNPGSKWFLAELLQNTIPVQDVVHEGAKLRTRFVRIINDAKLIMHIGSNFVSPTHVSLLMKTVSKEIHGLRISDLNLEDKMNYDAVVRLCNPKVQVLLKNHIQDSKATCFYLKIIQYILSSYTEKQLCPSERVYRIWYAVSALRYWRFWLKCDKTYPLMSAFISLNSYMCAKILAHSLIAIIVKFEADNTPELLTTWLMNSQHFEMYF